MFDYWVVSLFNDVLEFEDIGMFDLIGQHVFNREWYISLLITNMSHTCFVIDMGQVGSSLFFSYVNQVLVPIVCLWFCSRRTKTGWPCLIP